MNINSLRNKIVVLREIMSSVSLDYCIVSETKLDTNFLSVQFHIYEYKVEEKGTYERTYVLKVEMKMDANEVVKNGNIGSYVGYYEESNQGFRDENSR